MKRLLSLLLILWAACAVAQESETVYGFEEWQPVSERVTAAVESGKASTDVFENLRIELTNWRDYFQTRQSDNALRITTTEAQIDALGPAPGDAPADDEVVPVREAASVTVRRQVLQERLAELMAPVLLASEAHAEVDGLISEIDRIVRTRQAKDLYEAQNSPLWPQGWASVGPAIARENRSIGQELIGVWAHPVRVEDARASLPEVIPLAAAGILALLFGWRLPKLFPVRSDLPGRANRLRVFIAGAVRLIAVFVGIAILDAAIDLTGLLQARTAELLSSLLFGLFVPVLYKWLADQIFGLHDYGPTPLLDTANVTRSYRLTIVMGWLIGFWGLLNAYLDVGSFDQQQAANIAFPFLCVVALVLFDFGRSTHSGLKQVEESLDEEDVDEHSFQRRIYVLSGQGLMALAVIGVAALCLGFAQFGERVISGSAMSCALMMIVYLLQRFSSDVYSAIRRKTSDQSGLVPVLLGIGFSLAALPIAALIWGARLSDLTELWAQFVAGFEFGGARISPRSLMTLVVALAIGVGVTRLIQGALRSSILPRTRLDVGARNAIIAGVGYLGVTLATVGAITAAGIDLSSIALVAGALSVGIGFGLQNVVSNFVSGIILLIERPISEGDWIEVDGTTGYVRDISVRSTQIETFDRSDVIIPNADLVSGSVTNYTKGSSVGRVIVPVGVAYGSDAQQVEAILRDVVEAHPMVLARPAPSVLFMGFGDSSLDFEVRAILRDVNWSLSVKSDLRHQIYERLDEAGIEIPFPQRVVWHQREADAGL